MKCSYCKDTGKYKKPENKEKFDKLVETEMDKAHFVSYAMAEEKAYKKVTYTEIDCPYCKKD